MPRHCAIQDDYSYWKAKDFQTIAGKPFPIDLSNPHILSIFFDDNADDPDQPTIYPFDSLQKIEDQTKLLGRGNIVAVNPKEAILDEDYFIKKINALLYRSNDFFKD